MAGRSLREASLLVGARGRGRDVRRRGWCWAWAGKLWKDRGSGKRFSHQAEGKSVQEDDWRLREGGRSEGLWAAGGGEARVRDRSRRSSFEDGLRGVGRKGPTGPKGLRGRDLAKWSPGWAFTYCDGKRTRRRH